MDNQELFRHNILAPLNNMNTVYIILALLEN